MAVKLLKAGKHSCVGHLSAGDEQNSSADFLDRPAMLVYVGEFDSMDGPVEVTEAQIDLLIKNHNSSLEKLRARVQSDEALIPLTPPLQLDHSTSAVMTVGRVIGKLWKGQHLNDDGVSVAALMGERIRVLGTENTPKVKDGRWANVSIGADLEAGILNELSITPFPAAPNASLLKASLAKYKTFPYTITAQENEYTHKTEYVARVLAKEIQPPGYGLKKTGWDSEQAALEAIKNAVDTAYPKMSKGEPTMHEKLKKHLMEKCAMSEGQAVEHMAKMKAHLMKHLGMEEDAADKHMSAMEPEHAEKMGAAMTEGAKMADDVKEEEKKLAARKPELARLAKGMSKDLKAARLAGRIASVGARLSKLQACAKITPAERKKLDMTKLASMTDEAREAVLGSYEGREPVIDARIHGTSKAVNLSKLEKQHRLARLEAETKKDLGHELSEKEEKVLSAEAPATPAPEQGGPAGHEENMKHLEALVGDHPQKEAIMALAAKMVGEPQEMSAESTGQDEKHLSGLVENVNKLHTQFDGLVKLFGEATGMSAAELTE